MAILLRPERRFFEQFDEPLAVILGMYPTSNLGAVRCLGRAGVPSIVLDANRNQAAFFSKYAKGVVCPHPKHHEKEYIDFLLELGTKLPEKGILFPTGDTECLAVLKHRDRLEKYYHFTMADYEIVNSIINKELFYHLLQSYNIDHPKTFFPTNPTQAKEASTLLSYPCLLKPVYTTYFRLDFHTKLFVAHTSEELISLYEKAYRKGHQVMVQEIIPGDARMMFGFNAYYDRTGASFGGFVYQRLREWPLGFGNGCYIQSVEQPVLNQITSLFVKRLRYYGIVDAEFKYDARDKTFKFIEMNPRIWMQNSFPARFGKNLAYFAYLDALGKQPPKKSYCTQKKAARWVYFLEDIQSSRTCIGKGDLSILAWLQAYRLSNEHAVFAWDDPFPFFFLGSRSIPVLLSSLVRRTDTQS